jgi:alanyl-tRNA synthetase
MTEPLYYKDAYLNSHKSRISKIEENRILLEETIFFPQTSTEPGDMGRIGGYKIAGLKKAADDIWHLLNGVPPFREGDLVDLELDWDRRYKAMRLHSALHLWAGVFEVRFNERAVAGVVKSDVAHLVFKHVLTDDVIREALEQANRDILTGLEIKTYDDKVKQGFKWCRVGDYVPIPCGGLHVKDTKEIGRLVCGHRLVEGQKQKLELMVE